MGYISTLSLIALTYLAVLASPGPNFFILSQMALEGKAAQARRVVVGLSTGSVFWVTISMAGLATVLARHPHLADVVRIFGAVYLIWYGGRLLKSAFTRPRHGDSRKPQSATFERLRGGFRVGLLTGVTNPKGAAFWTSAFAALMPAAAPLWFHILTVATIAVMSLGWHLGITLVFGKQRLRDAYLRIQKKVNGAAGSLLISFGLYRAFNR
ncbi:LysE family translocator [Chitinasiproducens palmae]|uniref:Threonine/homoserine/homoserine lactone efflux protein n=1 Tax=Chitinasiproducens palmae TaxID=1770053 RepID=A0A1H2PS49_9BURK|nr:LysE family transporter [Chitinasiproducens palmae]SDV49770.1 Threonine/homoserine/homoserine lactone efflux protein [Chitinasiproducens palmae]